MEGAQEASAWPDRNVGGSGPTSGWPIVVTSILGLAMLVTAAIASSATADARTLFFSAAVAVLALTVIGVRFDSTRDPFDALTLYSAAILFYFPIHAFWLLSNKTQASQSIPNDWTTDLAAGEGYIALAYVALLVGYALAPKFRSRRLFLDTKSVSAHTTGVLYFVGFAANATAAAIGGFSKANAAQYSATPGAFLLTSIGWISLVAIVLLVCRRQTTANLHERRAADRWLALACSGQVVLGLAFGQKQQFAFLILAIVVAYNYSTRRVRLRTLLAAAVLFVFVITPVVQAGRTASNAQSFGNSLGNGQSNLASTKSNTNVLTDPKAMLNGFSIIQQRTGGAEAIALAIRYTPDPNGWRDGEDWAGVLFTFVPRFLWPDKPTQTVGKDFSINYAGESTNGYYGLTVAPTQQGDLWMNFGISGLVIGMLLIGVLLRFLSSLPVSAGGTALYVVLIIPLMLLEQDMGTSVQYMLVRGLVCYTAIRLLAGRTDNRLSPGPARAS